LKKISASFITLALFFSLFTSTTQAASSPIKVYVDGNPMYFDVDPVIKSGTTLVEFRTLFNALGLTVGYDSKSKKVSGQGNGVKIELVLGSKTVYINGQKQFIDVPAQSKSGRTLVPLRFVGQSTGAYVEWDSKSRVIEIRNNIDVPTTPIYENTPVLGQVALGMSKQEVKSVAAGTLINETSTELLFQGAIVLGYSANVLYEFRNDKLIAINVYHDVVKNQSDLAILETFFVVMFEEIYNVYGDPVGVDTNWFDDVDGNRLSAFWQTVDHSTLLAVHVTLDYSTYGGIRIAVE
jgi:Copper amine oxidase N-terminal domain